MGWYDHWLLPYIIDFSCSRKANMAQRQALIPEAGGEVLEIGAGSGLNISFYDPQKVQHLYALDPSPEMMAIAHNRFATSPVATDSLIGSAESIPLPSASMDAVVTTYSLCTINEPLAALSEVRRVLKPGGRLLFCEHGSAPDAGVRAWQNRLDRPWGYVSGGCHLNRDIQDLLISGGFGIQEMETGYIPGWKPLSYTYRGIARKA